MSASGPACPDRSTAADTKAVIAKYGLQMNSEALALMEVETPKQLDHVTTRITGSVRQLCAAANAAYERLGYEPVVLADSLACEAREAGAFLSAIARTHAGGETVVHLTGKGGRNQELALGAAEGIAGLEGTAVFSVGSDGTNGPTDAAGGYVDGATRDCLAWQGVDLCEVLRNNDAYHVLQKVGGIGDDRPHRHQCERCSGAADQGSELTDCPLRQYLCWKPPWNRTVCLFQNSLIDSQELPVWAAPFVSRRAEHGNFQLSADGFLWYNIINFGLNGGWIKIRISHQRKSAGAGFF